MVISCFSFYSLISLCKPWDWVKSDGQSAPFPQENHKTKLSRSSFPINSTRCPVTASLEPSSLPQEIGLSCTIGFLAGCIHVTLLMVGKVQKSIESGQSRQNSPLPFSFLFFSSTSVVKTSWIAEGWRFVCFYPKAEQCTWCLFLWN